MKAILTTSHGNLSVLKLVHDHPKPSPEAHQVLIKVEATALNFHDIFTRRGMPGIKINLPIVVGSDISGTIVEVGWDLDSLLEGQRVLVDPVFRDGQGFGMIGETVDGGRAEYVVANGNQVVPIPDGVTFDQAAALPLAYGTAWRMLVTNGQIKQGETILILGASGGVGVACVQIAKQFGLEVVACASSDEKLSKLRDIGADHLVNYAADSFRRGVYDMYGKPRVDGAGGVDVAVNFTGGDTLIDTQKCVKLGGRILTCGATAGYQLDLDARYWWTFEHRLVGSNGWTQGDLIKLMEQIAKGRLDPVVDQILPLEQTVDAERTLEDRKVFGKIILKP